jgi:hypothetical protein
MSVRGLAWLGVLLIMGVAAASALLWPFHASLLWAHNAPPARWRFAPLGEGVRFQRSDADVYLSAPASSPEGQTTLHPSSTPRPQVTLGTAEAAARLLKQRKGGEDAKTDSVAAAAEQLDLPPRSGATGH